MTNGHFFKELAIGQTARLGGTRTGAEMVPDSAVRTDTIPMHLDAATAPHIDLGEPVARGLPSAGPNSGVPGMRLFGPGAVHQRRRSRPAASARATVEAMSRNADMKRAPSRGVCTAGDARAIESEGRVQGPWRG